MNNQIQTFIASKQLSDNSRAAYLYDLQQFMDLIEGRLTKEKLALYEHSLSGLKVSAKKRKLSAVNQFLYFLYENGQVDHYYKLTNKEKVHSQPVETVLLSLELFYQDVREKKGQLIALLIVELGLLPSEIQVIQRSDIDYDFAILRVRNGAMIRIIKLPRQLLPYLERHSEQLYLFDRQGKTYSRQWFFNRLKSYLEEIGQSQLTSQDLRQQFILRKKEEGKTINQLAQELGLKQTTTLEKYY